MRGSHNEVKERKGLGVRRSGLERPCTNESASLGLSGRTHTHLTGCLGKPKAHNQGQTQSVVLRGRLCFPRVEGWVKVALRSLCLSTHDTITNSHLSRAN